MRKSDGFKVGDIVRVREFLRDGTIPWSGQYGIKAGDVGVVREVHNPPSTSFYVTFARTGDCPVGWGLLRFDMVEEADG